MLNVLFQSENLQKIVVCETTFFKDLILDDSFVEKLVEKNDKIDDYFCVMLNLLVNIKARGVDDKSFLDESLALFKKIFANQKLTSLLSNELLANMTTVLI